MTNILTKSNRYEIINAHIGQGTYGKVDKARDLIDGEIVAIKKVKLELISDKMINENKTNDENFFSSRKSVASIGIHFTVLREIKVMRELSHINVMSIKDVYTEGDFVNLVSSYMSSDLRRLFERRVRLNEAQIKCIMLQILQGLIELHSHWIMHRDLAPSNILINSEGICKIADFGLSRSFGSPRQLEKTPEVVTLWYRAPELLYGASYYQDRIDIWSLGCIFAELLRGGKALFPGQEALDQLSRIFELCGTPSETNWPDAFHLPSFIEFSYCPPKSLKKIFVGSNDSAVDLLEKMLALDPMKRISTHNVTLFIIMSAHIILQILKHNYFSTQPVACSPKELPLHLL